VKASTKRIYTGGNRQVAIAYAKEAHHIDDTRTMRIAKHVHTREKMTSIHMRTTVAINTRTKTLTLIRSHQCRQNSRNMSIKNRTYENYKYIMANTTVCNNVHVHGTDRLLPFRRPDRREHHLKKNRHAR
jgi:hypothetical protein